MRKLKILQIVFDFNLKRYELPAFRGAIIRKAGQEHVLFHNHNDKGFLYSYPLIQYKTIGENPMILCIEEGIDELQHLFKNKNWRTINVDGREVEINNCDIKVKEHTLQVWQSTFKYKIYNWLALNQTNHPFFTDLESETERVEFLGKILISNIISFAKGVSWTVDQQIQLNVDGITKEKLVGFKGSKMKVFDVEFTTNVSLPQYIGLGKSVSVGFGLVKRVIDKG